MTSQHAASSNDHAESPVMSGAATRYAEALFDLAQEAGAVAAIEADVKALDAMITASPEFVFFLKSPVYAREEKAAAISAIAEKAGYQQLTKNFLAFAAQQGRLFALPEIARAFLKLAADSRGEVAAEATSATPLSDEQMKRLRAELESMIGKAINLSAKVDPNLLGGLVVKVGSTMIDSSLRTKLNNLKTAMKEA